MKSSVYSRKAAHTLTTSAMIMRAVLFILFTFTVGLSFGQEFSYPPIKKSGETIKDFVPIGWRILDSAKGDLNNDKLADAAVVLQHTGRAKQPKDTDAGRSKDTVMVRHRILIILFKSPGNRKYHLAGQSNSFIVAGTDAAFADGPPLMEDPYQEIKIKNGILQLNFGLSYTAGSWWINNTQYKFRYQQNDFALVGANYYSADRATHESNDYSFNFLTKRRRLEKSIGKSGRTKISWKRVTISPLKTLRSFKAPFTWEVEEGVIL